MKWVSMTLFFRVKILLYAAHSSIGRTRLKSEMDEFSGGFVRATHIRHSNATL